MRALKLLPRVFFTTTEGRMPGSNDWLECRRALYSATSRSDKKRVPVAEIQKACISKRNRAGITTWFSNNQWSKTLVKYSFVPGLGFFFQSRETSGRNQD